MLFFTLSKNHSISLTLTNEGNIPLRCSLRFAHWVNRDLGILEAGQEISFAILQDEKDGALYIKRDDKKRRMMIEMIQCARSGDWTESVGGIDLSMARATRPSALFAKCALAHVGQRVSCNVTIKQ